MIDSVLISTPTDGAVSFIVPALNEEDNLHDTVDEIHRAAEGIEQFEIVIVNDGSTDNTAAIMNELAASNPHIRVIHNQRNIGLGGAYKIGVAAARMPYVMMVPGDNNHPAEGIIPILQCRGRADIIIPYVSNPEARSVTRRFISLLFVRLINILFGLRVRYYNGLVLHHRELVQGLTIETDGFTYQTEALVKLLKRGASFIQIAVPIASHGDRNTRAFRSRNILAIMRTLVLLLRIVYFENNGSRKLK